MYVQKGNLTVSWYGEQSIYHGGIISSTNDGNSISVPFGPISLQPNSSYSIDPTISPSPMRIIGTPPGGGCCIRELPSIFNFHNLTSPYLGPGEYYSIKGYVKINGKINGAYPSTYVGYEEKYINSKDWGYCAMKTIRSNQCVELNIPYRDLINVRCIRMFASNIFGVEKDPNKAYLYTALISPVNRTIEIYNSTGFAVGAYNMVLGSTSGINSHYNLTLHNQKLTQIFPNDQGFETTVSYLNSSISPNYFLLSPDRLSEKVYARDNYTPNSNPLTMNGYSLCAGSNTYSSNGVNGLRDLIYYGFKALQTSLSITSPEYAILYSIIGSIIQYLENNYFLRSFSNTHSKNYGSILCAEYSYNYRWTSYKEMHRHFWGIYTGTDYINDLSAGHCNFTAYLLYSVSMKLPGFESDRPVCSHSELYPFSISSSYTLMGYYPVVFHE
ncbi:hypothetical protein ACNF42_07755 [Cuniculiplasma sp. SKW3]|uniref:hypothetical protein n=1 Tax=Cuniculiplasma sp. SKW3 TaxID=3400170 RepID=UPI003FD2B6BF